MNPLQIFSSIIVISLLGYLTFSFIERKHFKEKIESLESSNNILRVSNSTLSNQLKEALLLNEQNVSMIKKINLDQERSLQAIKKLNADLTIVKFNLDKTRNSINITPINIVSPNIVEAIGTIQQMQEDRGLEQ